MKLFSCLLPVVILSSASALLPPPPPSEVDDMMEYGTVTNPASESSYVITPAPSIPSSYIAPPPPSETEMAFQSFLQIGYASNYDYKGMVTASSLCKHGDLNYVLGTDYALSNGMILAPQLAYTDIYGGSLNDDNQTDFQLGVKDELFPNLTVQYSYNLSHGGFAGEYAKYSGEAHSFTQSLEFSVNYKFGISGYFAGMDAFYSFQGLKGWWLAGVVGYDYEINEKWNARLSGGISASWSYWQTSGANQIHIKLQTDYKVNDEWKVTPFLSANWLCDSGLKMNSRAGEQVFRPFTIMAGVQMNFQF